MTADNPVWPPDNYQEILSDQGPSSVDNERYDSVQADVRTEIDQLLQNLSRRYASSELLMEYSPEKITDAMFKGISSLTDNKELLVQSMTRHIQDLRNPEEK